MVAVSAGRNDVTRPHGKEAVQETQGKGGDGGGGSARVVVVVVEEVVWGSSHLALDFDVPVNRIDIVGSNFILVLVLAAHKHTTEVQCSKKIACSIFCAPVIRWPSNRPVAAMSMLHTKY